MVCVRCGQQKIAAWVVDACTTSCERDRKKALVRFVDTCAKEQAILEKSLRARCWVFIYPGSSLRKARAAYTVATQSLQAFQDTLAQEAKWRLSKKIASLLALYAGLRIVHFGITKWMGMEASTQAFVFAKKRKAFLGKVNRCCQKNPLVPVPVFRGDFFGLRSVASIAEYLHNKAIPEWNKGEVRVWREMPELHAYIQRSSFTPCRAMTPERLYQSLVRPVLRGAPWASEPMLQTCAQYRFMYRYDEVISAFFNASCPSGLDHGSSFPSLL